jgi:tetratricopeptide (TPR) repeat protein
MLRTCTLLLVLTSAGLAAAQIDQLPQSGQAPAPSQAPPRSDHEAGVSSSRDTKIDISPPKDDAKSHPSSDSSIADEPDDNSDVQEMHPWNPHKAAKDLEVGDFYFRRKNYRAALERYREALLYKPNDALSNFKLAECFAKLDNSSEAVVHYREYLKILPHGPLSKDAEKNIQKMKDKSQASETASTP